MNIGQLKDYTKALKIKAEELSNTDAYKEASKRNDEINWKIQSLTREYHQNNNLIRRRLLSNKINGLSNKINGLNEEKGRILPYITYYTTEITNLNSGRLARCCGIVYVNGLHKIHPIIQAYHLAKSMDDWNALQVVFTDTTRSTYYQEAKQIAVQGVVTHNPNSGSEVSHWTMTAEMIPALEKAEPINPPLLK